MTQQQEKLSAFMDGEIEGNDIIDAIKQDEALQAKWQRYHVYRGAMRKEASVAPQLDITASVAAALENEPAIVAPKRSRWQSLPLVGNVIPFRAVCSRCIGGSGSYLWCSIQQPGSAY
jgi:sigma-E factor negative regulatory protein RseA